MLFDGSDSDTTLEMSGAPPAAGGAARRRPAAARPGTKQYRGRRAPRAAPNGKNRKPSDSEVLKFQRWVQHAMGPCPAAKPLMPPKFELVVGSDCAGLLTESLALSFLGLLHKHAFVSESDSGLRKL